MEPNSLRTQHITANSLVKKESLTTFYMSDNSNSERTKFIRFFCHELINRLPPQAFEEVSFQLLEAYQFYRDSSSEQIKKITSTPVKAGRWGASRNSAPFAFEE